MEFKIVGRQNASENQENITKNIRQSDIPQQESQVIHSEIRYENPKLIRRDGVYYIGYENDLIPIEEWEAEEVYLHPERVYDVIFHTAGSIISMRPRILWIIFFQDR